MLDGGPQDAGSLPDGHVEPDSGETDGAVPIDPPEDDRCWTDTPASDWLTLCSVEHPSADPQCPQDRLFVRAGLDTGGDGVLAASEVETEFSSCAAPATCEVSAPVLPQLSFCELPAVVLQSRNLPFVNVGIDLSRADLQNARCGELDANIEDETYGYCHLECSDLRGANLSDADFVAPLFSGAKLCGARLIDARMVGADFRHADLRDVDFTRADLSGAMLGGTDLSGANLTATTLTGVMAADLVACPRWGAPYIPPDRSSRAEWRCVGQTDGQRFALVGPSAVLPEVRLTEVWLVDMDLTDIDLRGASLVGATLRASRFSHAKLDDADLSNADLSEAELVATSMTGTNLTGARLDRAVVDGLRAIGLPACPASLPRASWQCVSAPDMQQFALVGPSASLAFVDMSGWTLTGADLTDATLYGAILTGADLEHVDLHGADLKGVAATMLAACPAALPDGWRCIPTPATAAYALVGPHASLKQADLSAADLHGVDLTFADVTEADFTDANLAGATLRGVDLTGATLLGADLRGADLTSAVVMVGGVFGSLELADVTGALTDATTTCPDAQPGPC
jgi:uncharacterized protein YjbI with pentapeptide repeats